MDALRAERIHLVLSGPAARLSVPSVWNLPPSSLARPGFFARLHSVAANILRFNGVRNLSDGQHRIPFGSLDAILALRAMK